MQKIEFLGYVPDGGGPILRCPDCLVAAKEVTCHVCGDTEWVIDCECLHGPHELLELADGQWSVGCEPSISAGLYGRPICDYCFSLENDHGFTRTNP